MKKYNSLKRRVILEVHDIDKMVGFRKKDKKCVICGMNLKGICRSLYVDIDKKNRTRILLCNNNNCWRAAGTVIKYADYTLKKLNK